MTKFIEACQKKYLQDLEYYKKREPPMCSRCKTRPPVNTILLNVGLGVDCTHGIGDLCNECSKELEAWMKGAGYNAKQNPKSPTRGNYRRVGLLPQKGVYTLNTKKPPERGGVPWWLWAITWLIMIAGIVISLITILG